jgi:hypothetical protein
MPIFDAGDFGGHTVDGFSSDSAETQADGNIRLESADDSPSPIDADPQADTQQAAVKGPIFV